jgi:hypothetical protein
MEQRVSGITIPLKKSLLHFGLKRWVKLDIKEKNKSANDSSSRPSSLTPWPPFPRLAAPPLGFFNSGSSSSSRKAK